MKGSKSFVHVFTRRQWKGRTPEIDTETSAVEFFVFVFFFLAQRTKRKRLVIKDWLSRKKGGDSTA
jgi:hypothetical protein